MFVLGTNKKRITELSDIFTKSVTGKISFKWSIDIKATVCTEMGFSFK